MSRLSTKGYIQRTALQLGADEPVSAAKCSTLIDNVAHLVDESFKYRINWVEASDDVPIITQANPAVMWFSTQMARPNRFPRYDVRIATTASTGGTTVTARIVPGEYPFVPGANDGVIGSLSATAASGVNWTIDDTLPAVTTENIYINPIMPPVAGGLRQVAQHMPVRLVIEIEDSLDVKLVGVQVREYTE